MQLRDRFLSHVPRREADWDAGKRKAPDLASLIHTRGKHENTGREVRTAHVEERGLHVTSFVGGCSARAFVVAGQ